MGNLIPVVSARRALLLALCVVPGAVIESGAPGAIESGGPRAGLSAGLQDEPAATSAMDRFEELARAWLAATGAERDEAASAVRSHIDQTLGEDAITAFNEWFAAPAGSEEESDADQRVRTLVDERGVDWQDARTMFAVYMRLDSGDPLGTDPPPSATPVSPADVDLRLVVARETPVVGELWNVIGEFHNRSERTVWLVDRQTTLSVPPEVWGITSQGGSIGAFFPTVLRGSAPSEVLRLEPNREYRVVWKIDSWVSHLEREERDDRPGGWLEIMSRIHVALREFLFFQPGDYEIAANVHVWTTPPRVTTAQGDVGNTFTLSETRSVYVESSQWVLVFGAIVGGLACFAMLLLPRLRGRSLESLGGRKYLAIGTVMAVLLCSIGTVLVSRLGGTDFLIDIKIKDFWGAIAMGFVIQWLGLTYLLDRLSAVSIVTETGSGAVATTASDVEKEETSESEGAGIEDAPGARGPAGGLDAPLDPATGSEPVDGIDSR